MTSGINMLGDVVRQERFSVLKIIIPVLCGITGFGTPSKQP